jgi:hypothetical protein
VIVFDEITAIAKRLVAARADGIAPGTMCFEKLQALNTMDVVRLRAG